MIEGLLTDLLEVKSGKPIREKVKFELCLRLFNNLFDKLLHLIDLACLSVPNWQQIHRLKLLELHLSMFRSFRTCGLLHCDECTCKLFFVGAAELAVLLSVQVKVEGGDRIDLIGLGAVTDFVGLHGAEHYLWVFVGVG